MQVLCMAASQEKCDLECPVCHKQFAIYYSRNDTTECDEARDSVLLALLEHHSISALAAAHPADAFNVPAWDGPAHHSGAALLSGAPVQPSVQAKAPQLTIVAQQRMVS